MPTETTWIYPKPKSWDEFEAIVWDLFRRSWGDPEAQRYGRSGQEQHGIDVFGRSQELGGAYVGVQCKRYEDEQLTEKVIRNEIRKLEDGIRNSALPFIPAEFIIATTASRDVVLQNKIIQINQERVTSGGFSVALRFWEDLSDMLASPGYADLSRKHYPTLASQDRTKIDELNILKQAVMEKRQKLKEKVAEPFAITGNPYPFGKALDLNAGQGLVGRDGIIEDLVKRIRGEKTIFLTGEGGVGKTSLLRAGLMPAFLKEDHLPILLEASEEPLEVSIKRQFVRDIENTVYLKTQSLGSFLQAVADCLPKGSLVILFVDNFEAFFDHDEAQKEHFRQEWASSIASQANIRWLFSRSDQRPDHLASPGQEIGAGSRPIPGAESGN